MKASLSDYLLEEILNLDDLKQLFSHFAKLTDIDVSLHNIEGEEILSYRIHPERNICELVKARQ